LRKFSFLLLLFFQQTFAQQTSILFLGNSYTYTNNMPDLLYQLSLAGGDSISWDSNTPGGYSFQNHTQDATSVSKINSQPWNFVVLQGQSQEPSVDTAYVVANVFPYAMQLNNLVQANDSCTQTIFFMTWGRKNGDAQNCAAYPPVCTYSGMQQQLENRYLQMGNDNHAIVAPVGEAWKNVIATNPAFDLYISDESHPSLYGSYLAACVFYATIYKRSPLGINFYAGLPVNDAVLLQTIAGNTVLDSLQLWNTEIYYPDAGFTFTSGNSTSITTFNSDTTATTWYWDNGTGNGFVQGTASEILNFPNVNTYTVCLAVSNGCHSDTSCQTINSATVGMEENKVSEFQLSQNFSEETFSVQFPENEKGPFSIHVFDATGKQIYFAATNESKTTIRNFIPGIYFIMAENGTTGFTGKSILIPAK
jgi:hypothetical protein